MKPRASTYLSIIGIFIAPILAGRALAHEGTGRAGLREPEPIEAELEFYSGRRGYLHGGLGIIVPIGQDRKLGAVAHVVREETGGDLFPSLGAEFIQQFDHDVEIEAFAFGYLPVQRQHAWAFGLRGNRALTLGEHLKITPFFGPAYAHVRAIDEGTSAPVGIGHLMLFGGVAITAGPVEFTAFGSQSFFSRDPRGLETHVDLEEMTHFAAYENNDGFARHTAGAELSYAPTDWLKLTARYAWIRYDDATRHSLAVAPSVKLGTRWEIYAGAQLLRGDGPGNDLLMTGLTLAF